MASSFSSSPFSHLPSPPASGVGGGGGGGGGGGANSAAVDAIIAEAMDLCALEHIAALNTAHLPRHSALPSHLESRFRALKSFPAANSGAPPPLQRTRSAAVPTSPMEPKTPSSTGKDAAVVAGKGPKPDSPSGLSPPPPIASRSSRRGGVSPSPSPPRRHTSMCCFAFSPKKAAAAAAAPRSGGGGGGGKGTGDWESNERIFAELKAQRRKLKKALQEQAKARREAAKMVHLTKQASARMTTFAIDDGDELHLNSKSDVKSSFCCCLRRISRNSATFDISGAVIPSKMPFFATTSLILLIFSPFVYLNKQWKMSSPQ